ncbi:MAG: pantoate--beta-alanine ligase [Magnetovibrio sp.]|nr:pantoate--beta-alanine ligase [Magnetovibrio sp.]
MKIVRTISDLRKITNAWRQSGASFSLVPTMGGLHEGHLSLVRAAVSRADKVVVTIFVNPTQFAPNEDFAEYPRDEDADSNLLLGVGADLIFAPTVEEMYSEEQRTKVLVEGLGEILEGEFRPHFFCGVATVVSKLLVQAMPDIAIFGEKDYQQLCVIRAMVRDLNFPTKIIAGETVREPDGLAMSSRNILLNEVQRAIAPSLSLSLREIGEVARGCGDIAEACHKESKKLTLAGFSCIDYITFRDAETLEPMKILDRPARVLGAAWLEKVRLIDNIGLIPE